MTKFRLLENANVSAISLSENANVSTLVQEFNHVLSYDITFRNCQQRLNTTKLPIVKYYKAKATSKGSKIVASNLNGAMIQTST